MKYLLKYKDIDVGILEGKEEDFLNLWGSFKVNIQTFAPASGEVKRLKEYIELSIRESELAERDHLEDLTEQYISLEREVEPYLDILESEEWVLIDEGGNNLKILSPSFKPDNSIVWRWRV